MCCVCVCVSVCLSACLSVCLLKLVGLKVNTKYLGPAKVYGFFFITLSYWEIFQPPLASKTQRTRDTCLPTKATVSSLTPVGPSATPLVKVASYTPIAHQMSIVSLTHLAHSFISWHFLTEDFLWMLQERKTIQQRQVSSMILNFQSVVVTKSGMLQ